MIGNPPYVRVQELRQSDPVIAEFLGVRYRSAVKNFDIYLPFFEIGLSITRGQVAYVAPNKWFATDYGEGLRKFVAEKRALARVVDFKDFQLFADATNYTCITSLSQKPTESFVYVDASSGEIGKEEALPSKSLSSDGAVWSFTGEATAAIIRKLLKGSIRLLDLPADMSRGSSSGDDEVFVIETGSSQIEDGILRHPIFATDFNRYNFSPSNKWRIIFPYRIDEGAFRLLTEKELQRKFPKALRYLLSNQTKLERRKQYAKWYGYSAPRNLELHDRAHILVPLLADRGLFTLIPDNSCGMLCPMASGGFTITMSPDCPMKPKYILGLLNSRLLFWKLKQASNLFRGGWITCTKQYFGELPIRNINFSDARDKAYHEKMISLVERMLDLHEQFALMGNPTDQTYLKHEIDPTEREIDQLVYALYGLTEADIAVIEGQ